MADGFEAMVDSAVAFFTELQGNNRKEWFDPRKEHYIADIRKPGEFLGDLIAEDLARLTGAAYRPKLFRIYRDVRFSKDKTPFKTHQHLLWSRPDGDALSPAFFFGIAPDYLIVGAGVMGLKGDGLTRFRAHIDAHGDAVSDALEELSTKGIEISDWGPEPLKRVPKPYDVDHPHGDLLRRKALAVRAPLPDEWRQMGLVKAINTRLGDIWPLVRVLQPG